MLDSHVHFWDRDRFDYRWLENAGDLSRNFLPDELLAEQPAVEGMVFVQADCRQDQALHEAAWVHELADAGAPIVAVVAYAPLHDAALVAPQLTRLAELPLVAGVRRLLQNEPHGFALEPTFVDGVRLLADVGFTMDLCIRDHQLPDVTGLVEQCPEVRFVLDHLGKPTVADDAFASWADNLSRLAELPNVRCKLSGLITEAPLSLRSPADLQPWIRHALDVFGPERCMFGSDWPVVLTAGTYDDWLTAVSLATEALSPAEQALVMGGTARATYVRT